MYQKNEGPKHICKGCNQDFASKSALFRHLRASGGKCFPPEEYQNFLKYFVNAEENREKIIILYGYIPGDFYLNAGLKCCTPRFDSIDLESPKHGVCDGDHAAELIQKAIEIVSHETNVDAVIKSNTNAKCNRSFGHSARATQLCQQDECTGALTEVMTARAPKLLIGDCPVDERRQKEEVILTDWIQKINATIEKLISGLGRSNHQGEHLGKIRVFGRLQAPKKFNAEMDVNHCRVDYLFPADLLFGKEQTSSGMTLQEFLESVRESHPIRNIGNHSQYSSNGIESKHQNFLYISQLKKLMQKFCCQIIEVCATDDGDDSNAPREQVNPRNTKQVKFRRACTTTAKGNMKENAKVEKEGKYNEKFAKQHVLKRKLYHNFSQSALAHDFLSYRRVDRFFHRATIRYSSMSQTASKRPFIILSAKGDLFLNGQFRGMIGLFIAIVRGLVDEAILDCVFDEDYPNLVPCPFAPATGLFQGEVNYASWEGKMNSVLTPRKSERWEKGWKSEAIINTISDFEEEMYRSIARVWELGSGSDSHVHMASTSNWITSYLEPWAKRANEQFRDYQKWKTLKDEIQQNTHTELSLIEKLTPPLNSVSLIVPPLYQKVLELLREADKSGSWPSTSPKRQLVMVSTTDKEAQNDNVQPEIEVSSAYNFLEGQGGASGSFSVGATPGQGCELPKGNSLFPELMRAAFELEIALCPKRIPSSTIAINRNAQFRPHIDNGVGATGQSRSLIVGLGTYSGGELMVEGEKYDIRYNPIEFNGWTERHWTCPFLGERYSLVWFTPKGCEGIRGIDLCI